MKAVADLTSDEARAAAVFRALGNPARIRILRELAKQPGCLTGDLVGVLPLAQSTVSEHLGVLKGAGLVQGSLEGDRCYCLDRSALEQVIGFCNELLNLSSDRAASDCC